MPLDSCDTHFLYLSLSWRSVYWTGFSINLPLALLQIAAKLHDLLISFSLSQVILYYVRQQLLSERGTNFGVLNTAYSVAAGSSPLLRSFWNPLNSSLRPSDVEWCVRVLVYIVLVVATLGLAANPAVSITLLPRLDWWPAEDFFYYMDAKGNLSPLSHAGYSMYIPSKVFPTVVNATSLPAQDGLAASPWLQFIKQNDNSSSPLVWTQQSLPQYSAGLGAEITRLNTSLTGSFRSIILEGFSRSGNLFGMNPRSVAYRTDTLITNEILTDYVSLANSESGSPNWNPSDTAGGPWTVQVDLPKDQPKVPRVSVWCDMQPSFVTVRNLTLIFGQNSTNNPFLHNALDFSSVWDEETLSHSNKTLFEWMNLPQIEHMLAALILVPSNEYGDSNVTVCTVQASWSTTSMWAIPEQNKETMSNFTYMYPLSDAVTLESISPNEEGYGE